MLKLLFFTTALFLIKIGDFYISFIRVVLNLLLSFFEMIKGSSLYKSRIKYNNHETVLYVAKSKMNRERKRKRNYFKNFRKKILSVFGIGKNLLEFTVQGLFEGLLGFSQIIIYIMQFLLFLVLIPSRLFSSMLIRLKRRRIKVKKSHKKAYKPSFFYKLRFFILGIFVSFFLIFLPLLGFVFLSDLPNPTALSANYIPKTTKLYDRNGKLLYEIYASQNRTMAKLSDVPKSLINATIAIEDKDFYFHPGFDVRGIIRAFISNVNKNDLQGGSTITQQLIRSAFLSPAPDLIRKIKEVALAFWAERLYSKDQILELYFNYVPYGGTAWGAAAASGVYFDKKISDLTLAESALLAGLPRAPSVYSPYSSDNKRWKKRQKEVLDAMLRLNMIDSNTAKKAYDENLTFKGPFTPIKAPHFVMYVKDLLVRQFGLSEVERGGLSVTTSLDLTLQEKFEKIIADEVDNNRFLNIQNGASLVTNPQNGDVIAMIGSKDYFDKDNDGNVNVVLSKRQPGSTIKLVTYTLALSSKLFTESTILDDSPLTIATAGATPYTPVNYDGKYHGRLPLRLAFANSLNIPAVRVASKLGVEGIVLMGNEMGITSWTNPNKYGVSITLGGADVTMLDLATAYGTIANHGKKVDLNPILEIQDFDSKVIYKKEASQKQVVDEGVAFIVSDILADNNARSMEFGLSSPLSIPSHRVSVKTGTTDNKRDNWTIGFSKNYLVAAWVGNNDNSPMSQYLTSGITGAAPIWNKIMASLLRDIKDEELIIPPNVVKKTCYGRDAYFLAGTENAQQCNPRISPTNSR